ncbi:MAG: sodium/pantothenate symporter [Anaerovibrio sp.]|uniref:sodium/pantothenate symporter n=1 Tax=Anaerovibrio sp. TaxID=1872532 RepID=UPI0025F69DA7|nr:sodium/pantothenate symporter [Anaerovibrio sp.]MCR5176845.1 sodium/pantothenate symporter [Anaerovibrio sp.]
MNGDLGQLLPLLGYMAFMIGISVFIRYQQQHSGLMNNFVRTYFIGNRDLGGFVLAMTTVATYSSVSSFVGGPGVAWNVGFGWVYMAVVQVTAVFLVLGIFGKRVALLARKFDAVTVIDIIRRRYDSNLLAELSAFIIVIFFCATMVAQFVGGAKLFEAVTGYSYVTGLILFGLMVVVYTTIGGFRAVAITDTCCAVMMMVGIIMLVYYVLESGGGYYNIIADIGSRHPEMLEPLSGGKMPYGLYLTQWILVGICTIALPQSVVRGLAFKNNKSLVRAMLIGTFVVGFMNIGINLTGILGQGVLSGELTQYGGADNIIPRIVVTAMPSTLASIAIIGPLAASISTISSLLLVGSSAIIKDVYLHRQERKGKRPADAKLRLLSMLATAFLGALVFVIALTPPSLIWLINMFAFGGLETAFFWTLLLGLYWRGANKTGAMLSMFGGTLLYCMAQGMGFKIMGLHQITIGITCSLVLFLMGSYFGKKENPDVLRDFFPE